MWLVLAIAVAILLALDALRGPRRRSRVLRKRRVVAPPSEPPKPRDPRAADKTEDLIGIDGCPGGWAVAMSNRDLSAITFTVVTDIHSFLDTADATGAYVAIDIPIGLPSTGSRDCDVVARRVLGDGQGSRVFPAPSRAALNGTSYAECCTLNQQAAEKKISQQTYAIIPKIREVDHWITPKKHARIREIHPEISFCIAFGGPLRYSKKTAEGRQERLAILLRNDLSFDPIQERKRLSSTRVGVDDLIDAAAALLTASRMSEGRAQVLGNGAVDARGLRMEIVA
jgi:predicted RNase H-like nuclease